MFSTDSETEHPLAGEDRHGHAGAARIVGALRHEQFKAR